MRGSLRNGLMAMMALSVLQAHAADPARNPAPSRQVIASAGPAPQQRPLATLERPRAPGFAASREPRQPVVRGAAPDRQPLPVGPSSPAPAPAEVLPTPRPVTAELVNTGEPTAADFSADEYDRYGPGDGVINRFNNFFYLDSEYLLWWYRGTRLPPLATAGVVSPTNMIPGAMQQPSSSLLFGGSSLGRDDHSGYRVRTGVWFNRDHTVGLEGSYFFLGERGTDFSATSTGVPILAVPFADSTNNNAESALWLASPGRAGTVSAWLESRLWGAEANLRGNIWAGECIHADLIGGFRTLGLDDNFELTATTTALGSTLVLNDRFSTRNRFYGGQLGTTVEYRWGRLSLDVTGKVALGNTHQEVKIGGNAVLGGLSATGGIFAQPGNIGRFARDRFAVVPEVGVNVGFQLTDTLRVFGGYNFLYWSSVARPGEQIDRSLNPVQLLAGIPNGAARPSFAFKGSDFWAHGINVGLEFRY